MLGTSSSVHHPSFSVTPTPYTPAHHRACTAGSALSITRPCNRSAGTSLRRNAQNWPPSGSAMTVQVRVPC